MSEQLPDNSDLIDDVPAAYSAQLADYDFLLDVPQSPHSTIYDYDRWRFAAAVNGPTNLVAYMQRQEAAKGLAQSHRDYDVTAVAIGRTLRADMSESFGGFVGYNVKPESGQCVVNLHAEQVALSKLRHAKLDVATAIAVAADPRDDDANPNHYPTLRPCGRCVDMLDQAEEIDELTVILGMDFNQGACQLYTFGALLEERRGGELETMVGVESFALQTDKDFDEFDDMQPEVINYLLGKIAA